MLPISHRHRINHRFNYLFPGPKYHSSRLILSSWSSISEHGLAPTMLLVSYIQSNVALLHLLAGIHRIVGFTLLGDLCTPRLLTSSFWPGWSHASKVLSSASKFSLFILNLKQNGKHQQLSGLCTLDLNLFPNPQNL